MLYILTEISRIIYYIRLVLSNNSCAAESPFAHFFLWSRKSIKNSRVLRGWFEPLKLIKKEIWLRRSHFVLLLYQVLSLQQVKSNLKSRAVAISHAHTIFVLKMLCTTEVGFMLRATSKWRKRRSGYPVSELLMLGGRTVGQPSALPFSDSIGKPGPPWPCGGREPTAPFPLEDRATGNLKDQTEKHFCPEQKSGSGWWL